MDGVNTDTSRVDKRIGEIYQPRRYADPRIVDETYVDAAFAQTLERELVEASARLNEAEEKIAYLNVGCCLLSRDALIRKITEIGSERWKAGHWLSTQIAEAVTKTRNDMALDHAKCESEWRAELAVLRKIKERLNWLLNASVDEINSLRRWDYDSIDHAIEAKKNLTKQG